MADSAVAVTAGAGTNIDTRTEGTNSNHRQVIVIGDPATNAGVAPVDVTNGLAVQIIPALPAGTNAIGKLAANSGVDIGDVDITSIAAGDNNIGNVDIVTLPTQGYSASATFTPAAASHVAGDCNGAAAEFASMGPSAGRIMITSASIEIDGGTGARRRRLDFRDASAD